MFKEEAITFPPSSTPQRNFREKRKKKSPISECMCNSWPGGRPGQAGNILETKLPFQRNLSFFTSVPKLFKLPKELNIYWQLLWPEIQGARQQMLAGIFKLEAPFQNSQGLALTWKCVPFSRHLTIFTLPSVFSNWFERKKIPWSISKSLPLIN